MNRPVSVFGIGNAIIDLQIEASDAELAKFKLTKGGMALTDSVGQRAILEGLDSRFTEKHAGGSVANSIAGMAQMGASVSFAGSLGKDPHGMEYTDQLAQLGVTSACHLKEGMTTGSCLILITPDAERTMNTNLAAAAELSPYDIQPKDIANAEWLYVEGYLLASPEGSQAAMYAMEQAKELGTKVALSFSDGFIVDMHRTEVALAMSKYVDLVFANCNEACSYTEQSDPSKALEMLLTEVPYACVTDGANGSWINVDGSTVFVDALAADAVDLTGAGDMYAAGILYGINYGLTAAQAGRLAATAAARVVAQMGARLPGDLRELVAQIVS